MISYQTLSQSQTRRRTVSKPQFVGFVTDMIVPAEGPPPRPQAFLVEQQADWTLPSHFHQEHQFQLFVAGGGTIGRNPIPPLAVHYASPHTGYGPLMSGHGGLSYLTLRAVGDTGAWYLPERHESNLRISKRQVHGAPAQQMTIDAVAALPEPLQESLIAAEPDGLAAWLLRMPAAAFADEPPGADTGGGRFYVVTQGSLRLPDAEVEALATIWVGASSALPLQAGGAGAEVVVLQFPAVASSSFIEAMKLPPLP
ncbi:hypothetical protein [Piscinibacter sakaiensis]|uniref:hypothetical protein n=1 Tax=Piscinibacter sakaiensis TaxID=1547922 RepID=UPI003AAF7393